MLAIDPKRSQKNWSNLDLFRKQPIPIPANQISRSESILIIFDLYQKGWLIVFFANAKNTSVYKFSLPK